MLPVATTPLLDIRVVCCYMLPDEIEDYIYFQTRIVVVNHDLLP